MKSNHLLRTQESCILLHFLRFLYCRVSGIFCCNNDYRDLTLDFLWSRIRILDYLHGIASHYAQFADSSSRSKRDAIRYRFFHARGITEPHETILEDQHSVISPYLHRWNVVVHNFECTTHPVCINLIQLEIIRWCSISCRNSHRQHSALLFARASSYLDTSRQIQNSITGN